MDLTPPAAGETLGYQDRMPVCWRAAGADDPTRAELLDEAQRVLMACCVLEEARRRGSDDEDAVSAEIDRLHLKMNLALEMLGSLLAAQQPRPAPQPLWLSAEGVLWLQSPPVSLPAEGAQGLVSIHLHRALARPLVLPAVIRHAGGGEISARFEGLSQACQSELERHVFLRHRRAIAGSRLPASR